MRAEKAGGHHRIAAQDAANPTRRATETGALGPPRDEKKKDEVGKGPSKQQKGSYLFDPQFSVWKTELREKGEKKEVGKRQRGTRDAQDKERKRKRGERIEEEGIGLLTSERQSTYGRTEH